MRLRGEDRLILVTAHAGGDLCLAELVRLMALRALLMAGRDRAVADLERMARRAPSISRELRLVDLVAVDAAARARVLRLVLGVALRARLGIERWRLMRAMTIATRLVSVCTDSMRAALRTIVTAQAC
jgi:hypothetical protein